MSDMVTDRTWKDIGLGEALIAISKKFNGTCEALKTKKYIHGFLGSDDLIHIIWIYQDADQISNI